MITSQPWIGKLDYWRQVIDDNDNVIWRLYLDCEAEEEDVTNLLFCFRRRYLIGQTSYILDRHLIDRVCTQFRR